MKRLIQISRLILYMVRVLYGAGWCDEETSGEPSHQSGRRAVASWFTRRTRTSAKNTEWQCCFRLGLYTGTVRECGQPVVSRHRSPRYSYSTVLHDCNFKYVISAGFRSVFVPLRAITSTMRRICLPDNRLYMQFLCPLFLLNSCTVLYSNGYERDYTPKGEKTNRLVQYISYSK